MSCFVVRLGVETNDGISWGLRECFHRDMEKTRDCYCTVLCVPCMLHADEPSDGWLSWRNGPGIGSTLAWVKGRCDYI